MKNLRTLFYALGLAGLTCLPSQAAPVETKGFLKYEVWFSPLRDASLIGTTVDMLPLDPNYPATPDLVSFAAGLTTRGVFPDNTHEQYGSRLTGWITPAVTGDYHFYLASDDASQLWISTDDTEASLGLVAEESTCCHGFMEPGASQTTLTPLHLVAGQKYAIQVLLKEGGGDDFVQVAWQEASGTTPAPSLRPLASTVLSAMADPAGGVLTITQQPASTSTPENAVVNFTIATTATTSYGKYTAGAYPTNGLANALGTKAQLDTFYQWFTNGVEVVGANGNNFSIQWPKKAQNGLKVKCYVAIPGVPLFSDEATLTVTDDTTAPTVVSATSDVSFTNVTVKFSEPVSDTALTASNYTLDQGATVTAVGRVDAQTVRLATSKLAEGTKFNLGIKSVQDTATPANTIAANTTLQFRTFVFIEGTVLHKKYKGFNDSSGYDINNLFNDPRYRDNPDRMDLMKAFEYPANGSGRDEALDPAGAANRMYMDTIEGYFIPPTSGNYVFFTAGADQWWLYLSTDENPANKHLIAKVGGWTDPRAWNTGHDTDMSQARSDTFSGSEWDPANTIALTAGKKYFMEIIHYDPSWAGGDEFAVNYKLEAETDPADGSAPKTTGSAIGYYFNPEGATITFTQQPVDATVVEGSSATFTVGASATSPYGPTVYYQWQTAAKGSSTWTDVAGATAATFKTPLLTLADEGRQYRVVTSVTPISETSSVVTVHVTGDITPPTATAGAMLSSTAGTVDVGVAFSEPVTEASAKALANYSISPGTITSITLFTNRFTANSQNPLVKIPKTTVLLKVTGLSGSGTLTVKDVADTAGNKMAAATLPITVDTKMKWDVVGGNEVGGANAAIEVAPNGWDVYSDGIAAWAAYDEATFVYEQITGDFDKVVRVEYQDGSSQWARAGLIARDVPNFGVDRATQEGGAAGRYQKVLVTPVGATLTGPGNAGAADWELNRRLDTGGQTTGATFTGTSKTPEYPNAWCRLQRAGQKFTMFRSDDGVNWVELGSTTWGVDDTAQSPMPATMYVGPEYSPENGNVAQEADRGTFLARFRDYGNYVAVFNPQLGISTAAGGKLTITWTSGTLVSSPTANGSYTPVSGATSPFQVTPTGTATFYRVQR